MFLNSIIGFSIKNKLIIGLFTLSLILYGVYELTRLPIDAVPDITNNQVQVITIAPSLGATDIERLVTFPVEQANSNIPGLHEIRSFSRFGLSLVTIVFDEGVDIYWARQQVSERLQSAKALIPPGVASPELGPVTTGLGEIYQYMVRPKKGYEHKYTSVELRTIQDWIVRRQLLSVKGVADVSSFGGHLKQYEIAIDPDKLQSMNISIEEVFNAIQNNNENTGGAYIEKGPTVLYIRTEGLVNSLSDLGNIPVKVLQNGVTLLLRDIAEVKLGTAVRYGAMHYDTLGEVAGAVVMMLKGGNSSEVIKDVKARVEIIQKSLPEGVVIEPFLDRTKMVNNAIGTVETNLLEGALIVIFVLVLFLGNVRAGLLVASVIPLSMLFAVIMMNTFGVSGNLMSLGALDFGLIVDGAVIIVEAVMHALTNHNSSIGFLKLEKNKMDETVKHSASKMMNSAVFGQVIILIVYLPIFSLQGIEGKMFKPMAQTVAFALMGAFILSLTYIPMMSSVFLSRTIHTKKNLSDKMMERLEGIYRNALNKILAYPKIVLSTVFALFAIAVLVLMQLGGEFIPTLEEGDFALETRVLPGSNLNVSLKASKQASAILMNKFPEVEKVVAKIGSGEVPTDPMPIDAQDLMIILKDKKEWTSAKTFNELAEKMGEALKDVPGVTFGFQYPVQMRFNELMTGARQDVVCKIFGENLDTLAHYAAELGKIASVVDGAQDVYVEPVAGIPQIVINYKRDLIARYGVKISDVNRVVNTAFAGGSAGKIYEGEKRFDLVVRLNKNKRQELVDVQNLLIPVSPSINIPLSHLADVEIKDGPNQIQREDAKRRIVVGFNVRGRDVQSIVDDLQSRIAKKIKLPPGYYVTYGGAFENLNAAKKRLGIAVPIALFLIFLLLFFAFNSVKQAALIFTAIPLSAIGGILALALRGMPFSISAGVGFIALFGVAVLNGIVLIAEFKRLKSEGITDLREIVVKGTSLRLRPVLMTALVASLGFLPMALSNGAGAEVQRPLATVVIGGLLIATFLTLFVLPIIYGISEQGFKMKFSNTKVTLILCLLFVSQASAQNKIGIKAAVDSAIANNLVLRNERLTLAYNAALVKTANNLPKTNLNFENGQINSSYIDQRFGLSQNIQFPQVYKRQKQLLQAYQQSSQLQVNLSELDLKRQVYSNYYSLVYLLAKERVLMQSDSMYAAFLTRAESKYRLGETGNLEISAAALQRQQIAIQLTEVQQDIAFKVISFKWLINTTNDFLPNTEELLLALPVLDSSLLAKHPQLAVLHQELQISQTKSKLEKSRFLPDLQLSYSNMSMKGVGADNQFYTSNTRFQSMQIGVGIPIFIGAQKAAVKAADIDKEIAANGLQIGQQNIAQQWSQAAMKVSNYKAIVDFYDSIGLQNSNNLKTSANRQLEAGEISYSDWVVLSNQSIAAQSHYLEMLRLYNEAVIELLYLMGK